MHFGSIGVQSAKGSGAESYDHFIEQELNHQQVSRPLVQGASSLMTEIKQLERVERSLKAEYETAQKDYSHDVAYVNGVKRELDTAAFRLQELRAKAERLQG